MQVQVNLRLDPELLAAIDGRRGLVPRNAWISDVLRWHLANGDARRVRDEKPPAPVVERSPVPPSEEEVIEAGGRRPSPQVIEKAEKLATARGIVSQPRPLVQKK